MGNRCFASFVRFFLLPLLYFILLSFPSRRNILSTDERPVLGYDVTILSDLLHFSSSHDALISSVQMLLRKCYTFFVSVSLFFAGATTLPCKLRSLLSKRVMKKDYRSSSQKSDECVENNGWQRGSGSSESRMPILDWLLVRRSHQTRVKYSTCFNSEDTLLIVT